MKIHAVRILAVLISFLPLVVFAQDTGSRTCRVIFLGAADTDAATLHLYDGTASREVELPRLNLSKIYTLPAGPLTLHLLSMPHVAKEPVNPATRSVTVAEAISDFYLLVSPDPSNKIVPVRMQVIDATVERFKSGQMLWFNLTEHDVGGQVGKQKLAIKAQSKVILDPPATGQQDYNVNLNFRIVGEDVFYPLCETRWVHNPDNRTLLFILNESGSRAPRILGFPDHREKKNP